MKQIWGLNFIPPLEKVSHWRWTDGNGRILALALLVILLTVRWFDPMPIMLARENIFDFYQRISPRDASGSSVTIVEIDSESLELDGQWPWSRKQLAQLLDAIFEAGPRMVALDILISDPDRHSPERAIRSWEIEDESLARALQLWISSKPRYDEMLADRMDSGPNVVVSVFGINPSYDIMLPTSADPKIPKALRDSLQHYRTLTLLLPEIEGSAALRGVANIVPDFDGTVRKANLVYSIDNAILPSLALEAFRAGLPSARLSFAGDENGLREIRLAPLSNSIALGPRAQIRPYFAPRGRGQGRTEEATNQRSMMASGILPGDKELDNLRNKWVLVGLTDQSLVHDWPTPLGEPMPGVVIQAQILENLLDESWLIRPALIDWVEIAAACLFGLAMILIMPIMPTSRAAFVFAGTSIVILLCSFALFFTYRLLIDASIPILAGLLCFAAMSSAAYALSTRQRRKMDFELAEARRVQRSMLPELAALKAIPDGVSVDASIDPASSVGGDFFDVVPLDSDRLLLLVADVSGKGLNAALFMALSKSLIQSVAIREPHLPPGNLLAQAQIEISRANNADMFVAVAACIIDTCTRELSWSVAGHPPPILLQDDQAIALNSVPTGLPLCLDNDETYQTGSLFIKPGSVILLATDGAIEAFDTNTGKSIEDFVEVASAAPFAGSAKAVIQYMQARLADAKPLHAADDRTLLAFALDQQKFADLQR